LENRPDPEGLIQALARLAAARFILYNILHHELHHELNTVRRDCTGRNRSFQTALQVQACKL